MLTVRALELRQAEISTTATAVIKNLFRQVREGDILASWARVRPNVVQVFSEAKAATVAATAGYVENVLADEHDRSGQSAELNLSAFATGTVDGRTIEGLVDRAPIAALTQIKQGAVPFAAFETAANLLGSIVLTELADTKRNHIAAQIAVNNRVAGYTRLLTPPSCSRCVILAGKWFRWNEGFKRHPRCDCTHKPVAKAPTEGPLIDPYAYFDSLSKGEQDRLFGARNAEAIRQGADIYRVENIRLRGLATATGHAQWGTPSRYTVDEIFAMSERMGLNDAGKRAFTRDMLAREGYITGPQKAGGNILGNAYEGYGQLGKGGTAAAARAAIDAARQTGVRDPLNRYTMTAAERNLYDAGYRLAYYKRTGLLPSTVGGNSADFGIRGTVPAPGQIALLEDRFDRLKTAAIQRPRSSLATLAELVTDMNWDDYRRASTAALAGGGASALRAAGLTPVTNLARRPESISADDWATWTARRAASIEKRAPRILARGGVPPRQPPSSPTPLPGEWPEELPKLTETVFNHILYGYTEHSGDGNGHLNGYATSPVQAFPKHWDQGKIFDVVMTTLERGKRGQLPDGSLEYRLETEGYLIGVRVSADGRAVESAYPVLQKYKKEVE